MKNIEQTVILLGTLGIPLLAPAANCSSSNPCPPPPPAPTHAVAPAPRAPAPTPAPAARTYAQPQAAPRQYAPPQAAQPVAPRQYAQQPAAQPSVQQQRSYTPAPRSYAQPVNSGSSGNVSNIGNPSVNRAQAPAAPANFSAQPRQAAQVTPRAYSVPPAAIAARRANGDAVLNNNGSASALHQINANRASLGGANQQPIPAGAVTSHANGSVSVQASGGRQYDLRPDGRLASFSSQGNKAEFRPNGQVSALHSGNLDMTRGVYGQRTIVAHGPNRSLIVSTGPRSGYVQSNTVINGHAYYQRTYVVNGVTQTRLYTYSHYHGVEVQYYVPAYRYAPAYYGWTYYPWATPVYYTWGWQAAPWYGAYATYYVPEPVYPAPSWWLTDYYISQTLANSYAAQIASQQAQEQNQTYIEMSPPPAPAAPVAPPPAPQDQNAPYSDTYAPATTPITPALKQELAAQVQQQLSLENAAAENPQNAAEYYSLDKVLVPNHLFLVDQSINVATANGTCSLDAGNVLRLLATPDDSAQNATLMVASSRQAECPAGQQVTVSIVNLQEMHNSFRAQLDSGLLALRDGQGQGGLPPAPQSAMATPPTPQQDAPVSDANAMNQLISVQQQADKDESQVKTAAFGGS